MSAFPILNHTFLMKISSIFLWFLFLLVFLSVHLFWLELKILEIKFAAKDVLHEFTINSCTENSTKADAKLLVSQC